VGLTCDPNMAGDFLAMMQSLGAATCIPNSGTVRASF
jgi:hypothetical protein